MDVNTRELRYFAVLAEELNFTRAAERLFISQPALSKQMRVLEESLRVQLVKRDHRSVSLTAAGTALLRRVPPILDAWELAQRAVAAADAAGASVVRVGISTSIGRGLLTRISTRFTELRPGWRLQIRQVDWSDPTAGLADGSSDVALTWLPGNNPLADLRWRVLVTEPRWVALPEQHRLAHQTQIDFSDLLNEHFLALPKSAGALRDYWLAVEHRRGTPARIGAEVRNADETFEAVTNRVGIALLAKGNAAIYQRDGVVCRPVHGIGSAQLALVWRASEGRAVVKDLIDACRASDLQ